MDNRLFYGAIVIVFLVVLLALMYLGWRKRQRSQAGLPRPQTVPDAAIEVLRVDGFYVATTLVDEPLNRVAVAGLGYRARAAVAVTAGPPGVVLSLAGEPDAFIPATDIQRIERSTWTIDRVVEKNGLVRLTWLLGDTIVDSYVRVTEALAASALITSVEAVIEGLDITRGDTA